MSTGMFVKSELEALLFPFTSYLPSTAYISVSPLHLTHLNGDLLLQN